MQHPKTRAACTLVLLALLLPSAAAASEIVFERTWHIDGSRLDQDVLVESGTFQVSASYASATFLMGCTTGASGVVEVTRVGAPGAAAYAFECVNAIVPTGETGVLRDANPRSTQGAGLFSLAPGEYQWTFQGAGYGDVTFRIVGHA